MAVRYFCDGCDDEILYSKDNCNVTIDVQGNSTTYNLCETCIKARMYPKKWTRPPKAASR